MGDDPGNGLRRWTWWRVAQHLHMPVAVCMNAQPSAVMHMRHDVLLRRQASLWLCKVDCPTAGRLKLPQYLARSCGLLACYPGPTCSAQGPDPAQVHLLVFVLRVEATAMSIQGELLTSGVGPCWPAGRGEGRRALDQLHAWSTVHHT